MNIINKWRNRGVIVACRLGELIIKTAYNDGLTETEIKFIKENESFRVFKKDAKVIFRNIFKNINRKVRKQLIDEGFGAYDGIDFMFLKIVEEVAKKHLDKEVFDLVFRKTKEIDFNNKEYAVVSVNLQFGCDFKLKRGFNIKLARKNESRKKKGLK